MLGEKIYLVTVRGHTHRGESLLRQHAKQSTHPASHIQNRFFPVRDLIQNELRIAILRPVKILEADFLGFYIGIIKIAVMQETTGQ